MLFLIVAGAACLFLGLLIGGLCIYQMYDEEVCPVLYKTEDIEIRHRKHDNKFIITNNSADKSYTECVEHYKSVIDRLMKKGR